jgi:hypothetical protein
MALGGEPSEWIDVHSDGESVYRGPRSALPGTVVEARVVDGRLRWVTP